MKKIALFVEGQTEQIFLHRLVTEILGRDTTSVILKRSIGGSNAPRQEIVRHASLVRKPKYYVLINDCGADNRVKSEILENIESLSESGFQCIVGLRDLYPLTVGDLPRLEKGLRFLPKNYQRYNQNLDIIVVVQEVETWFLAETHHLQRVNKRLTGSFINKYLGFNPYYINAMQRRHPSRDLNNIYKLVGKSYTKRYWQVQRLVNRLDFDHLFRSVRYDIPSLGELIDVIEKAR